MFTYFVMFKLRPSYQATLQDNPTQNSMGTILQLKNFQLIY